MSYHWQKLNLEEQGFLSKLTLLFDSPEVRNFGVTADEPFSRVNTDGVVTVCGVSGGKPLGVIFHDFRVNGGSYGREVSRRISAFVEEMASIDAPLVMILNTLGVRIMEGRTVFAEAFSTIPSITEFAQRRLLVTCAIGRCLGLGAVLFGAGHYRLSVRDSGRINLTGPEVLKLFFGQNFDFDSFASAEALAGKNDLVQEMCDNKEDAFRRIREIVAFPAIAPSPMTRPVEDESLGASERKKAATQRKLFDLLHTVGSDPLEVLPQLKGVVRAFLLRKRGRPFGVLVNPPDQPNNMVCVSTLRKYRAALELFRALRVPVISFADTPGADPRLEQAEKNIIGEYLETLKTMLGYPYPRMGVNIGRCFGGAAALVFTKNLGAERTIALKDTHLGVMHESIITKLFSGSQRLLAQWEAAAQEQKPDLSDLVAAKLVDRVIDPSELADEVDGFLRRAATRMVRNGLEQGASGHPAAAGRDQQHFVSRSQFPGLDQMIKAQPDA